MNRRELLHTLGVGSTSALLWGLGCGGPARMVDRPLDVSGEVRAWLRDAVARLARSFSDVRALAVTRRRTTAAIDLFGSGIARARRDGVVLAVRDRDGIWREHATTMLTGDGVRTAVRALVRDLPAPKPVAFPSPPAASSSLPRIPDAALQRELTAIMRSDRSLTSRIIYAAAVIDIDDVTVWSIGPGHDREQQRRHVRKGATRAAWNGTRPAIGQLDRGWSGNLDAFVLDADAVTATSDHALQLMTPGTFADGEASLVCDPSVTAAIVKAAVTGLLTESSARRRPAMGTTLGAPLLAVVDDPTDSNAYGSFAFDDAGTVAAPVSLIADGRAAGLVGVGRSRRPGHVGAPRTSISNLVIAPGTDPARALATSGWQLEGTTSVAYDPSRDRIVVGIARARELANGTATGRMFAELELVGELGALLAGIDGISAETSTHVDRDDVSGEPLWTSIRAPWSRTRGIVRARRRST